MSTHQNLDVLTRRISALLAKAEMSPFPPESEAFLAKAQELMARHSIDAALLRRCGSQDGPGVVVRSILIEPPYSSARTLLLGAAARSNGCRIVIGGRAGAGHQRCAIIGHRHDVEHALSLFRALSIQAARTMAAQPAGPTPRRFRHAFLIAYADRIGERLRASAAAGTEEAAHDHGRSTELVVRHRRDEVDRALAEHFPRLGRARISATSSAGLESGRAAADRAALGHGAIGGHRRLPGPER